MQKVYGKHTHGAYLIHISKKRKRKAARSVEKLPLRPIHADRNCGILHVRKTERRANGPSLLPLRGRIHVNCIAHGICVHDYIIDV